MIDLTEMGLENMNKEKEGVASRSSNSKMAFWE
jgi:hypothetical protein